MSHEVDQRFVNLIGPFVREATGEFDLIAVRHLDSAMSIARKGSDGLRIRLKYCLFV